MIVAMGLLYRQGYFQQSIDAEGTQHAVYISYNDVGGMAAWNEPPSPYTQPTSAPASRPARSGSLGQDPVAAPAAE